MHGCAGRVSTIVRSLFMKMMSSGMSVFFIQKLWRSSCSKMNSMPESSGSSCLYISPFALSSGESAISTNIFVLSSSI